jgi:hypothetical protein
MPKAFLVPVTRVCSVDRSAALVGAILVDSSTTMPGVCGTQNKFKETTATSETETATPVF